MAKKAAPKTGKAKIAAKLKKAAKHAKHALRVVNGSGKKSKAGKKPPAPRNRALPGMEHVRYRELDAFCEGIADAREKKNDAVADEKGYINGALGAMQKRGCMVYKHDGVELLFVPGDAKLRVRLTKDQGEGGDVADAGGAEEPDGNLPEPDDLAGLDAENEGGLN